MKLLSLTLLAHSAVAAIHDENCMLQLNTSVALARGSPQSELQTAEDIAEDTGEGPCRGCRVDSKLFKAEKWCQICNMQPKDKNEQCVSTYCPKCDDKTKNRLEYSAWMCFCSQYSGGCKGETTLGKLAVIKTKLDMFEKHRWLSGLCKESKWDECIKMGKVKNSADTRCTDKSWWPSSDREPCECLAHKNKFCAEKGKGKGNPRLCSQELGAYYDCRATARGEQLPRRLACPEEYVYCRNYNKMTPQTQAATHQYIRWLGCSGKQVPDEDKRPKIVKLPCDDPEWPAWMNTGDQLKKLFGSDKKEDEDDMGCGKGAFNTKTEAATSSRKKVSGVNARQYCRKMGAELSHDEYDLLIDHAKKHGKIFRRN